MSQDNADWTGFFDAAITVCDRDGAVIYMNEQSKRTFAADGGGKLLGRNLRACHEPESWGTIRRLIDRGESRTYTIEKQGKRKLIHQAPWRRQADGPCDGLVEISIELPAEMPHQRRD